MNKVKTTYLLVITVIGLIILSLYSTFAMFTKEATLANISLSSNLTTDIEIMEY